MTLGVLIVAGAAKVRTPSPTASALDAIGLPAPLTLARAMGVGEVILGIAAAIFGTWWLYALVAAAYASFSLFILWALNGNQALVSCGCFGHEDTPPTPGHLAFNAVAAAIAGLAITDPVALGDFDGTVVEAMFAAVLVVLATMLAIAALTALPRNLALVRGELAPAAQEFSLRSTSSTSTSRSSAPGRQP